MIHSCSLLAAESRALRNLAIDYARSSDAPQNSGSRLKRAWTSNLLNRSSAQDHGVSASFVVGADDQVVATFVRRETEETLRFDKIPEAFSELVRRVRQDASLHAGAVAGLTRYEGLVNLVAASRIQVETPNSSISPEVTPPILIIARVLDQEFLSAAANAYRLQSLKYFEEVPPQSYYPLPLQGVAVDFDPSLRRWQASAPVAVMTR